MSAPSSTPARPHYHHGDLAEALIGAAIAEIAATGVEAMSLRGLAKRLGVSPGAPFRHYASKRALLAAVAARATQHLVSAVTAGLAAAEADDAVVRLRAYGIAYLDWALAHPTHFRVVSDRALIAAEGGEAIAAMNIDLRAQLAEIILAGQAQGGIDPGLLPGEVAFDARALVYGLARMQVDGHVSEWAGRGDARAAMVAALERFIARLVPR